MHSRGAWALWQARTERIGATQRALRALAATLPYADDAIWVEQAVAWLAPGHRRHRRGRMPGSAYLDAAIADMRRWGGLARGRTVPRPLLERCCGAIEDRQASASAVLDDLAYLAFDLSERRRDVAVQGLLGHERRLLERFVELGGAMLADPLLMARLELVADHRPPRVRRAAGNDVVNALLRNSRVRPMLRTLQTAARDVLKRPPFRRTRYDPKQDAIVHHAAAAWFWATGQPPSAPGRPNERSHRLPPFGAFVADIFRIVDGQNMLHATVAARIQAALRRPLRFITESTI